MPNVEQEVSTSQSTKTLILTSLLTFIIGGVLGYLLFLSFQEPIEVIEEPTDNIDTNVPVDPNTIVLELKGESYASLKETLRAVLKQDGTIASDRVDTFVDSQLEKQLIAATVNTNTGLNSNSSSSNLSLACLADCAGLCFEGVCITGGYDASTGDFEIGLKKIRRL